MIPILYDELKGLYTSGQTFWNPDPDVVDANIPSHLICYLPDAITCSVREERNGEYELILTYPITGSHFDELYPGRVIGAKANPHDRTQLFRIYRTSKVLSGIITVYARHISYDLSGIAKNMLTTIITAGVPAYQMQALFQNTFFTGYSDITSSLKPAVSAYTSVRSALGGVRGSLLDTYGGEFHFDNYRVHLDKARGADNGVSIDYGKNLTDLTAEESNEDAYTELRPFATYQSSDGTEGTRMGTPVNTGIDLGFTWTKILDVTSTLNLDLDVVPSVAQIDAAAADWMTKNPPQGPPPTINVNLTEGGIAADAPLAGVGLCDTVTVRYLRFGINLKQKVVALEYDTLKERYLSITLGTRAASLDGTVNDLEQAVAEIRDIDRGRFSANGNTVNLNGGEVNLYGGVAQTIISPSEISMALVNLANNTAMRATKMAIYSLAHSTSSTTLATYTATIPDGLYLVFHTRYSTPVAAAAGMQIMQIGTASTTARIDNVGTPGNDIGAADTADYCSTVTVTAANDGTGTVTWKVKGRSYRRLYMIRLL